jgi:hypothetical protein
MAKANGTAKIKKTTTENLIRAVSMIEACIVVNDTRDSVDHAPDISFLLEPTVELIREVIDHIDAADAKRTRANVMHKTGARVPNEERKP